MDTAQSPAAPGPGIRTYLALTLLVFLLLFSRSMTRTFDLDEHQFVAPPTLLTQDERLPYRDYPYFHMPNLPFLYAGLIGWSPYKLLAARTVSVVCGTALVMLLFAAGWRSLTGVSSRLRWLIAGGAPLIYICSRLFTYTNGWAWNHDTALLCAVGAFFLYLHGLHRSRLWAFAASGFLVGCAAGIRLSFALIFVPFALTLVLDRSPLSRGRRALGLSLATLGAAAASLPTFVLWMMNPDRFVFGNLVYPKLNTLYSLSIHSPNMSWLAKGQQLLVTVVTDPGNAFLFAASAYALGYCFWRRRLWRSEYRNELILILGLLPALLVGSWGPTPTQYQYYYQLLPFLTLGVLYTVAARRTDPVALRRWAWTFGLGLLVAAGTGLPRWYWGVASLTRPDEWTPVAVHRTGEWIKANAPPGARVLTIDPAVPLEARMEVYPEFAVGRFVSLVGGFLSPEQRRRYHMAYAEELDRLLAERPPDAVFCDERVRGAAQALIRYATERHFRRLESPDGQCTLWVREGGELSARRP